MSYEDFSVCGYINQRGERIIRSFYDEGRECFLCSDRKIAYKTGSHKVPSFKDWLKKFKEVDDPIGDFAKDFCDEDIFEGWYKGTCGILDVIDSFEIVCEIVHTKHNAEIEEFWDDDIKNVLLRAWICYEMWNS